MALRNRPSDEERGWRRPDGRFAGQGRHWHVRASAGRCGQQRSWTARDQRHRGNAKAEPLRAVQLSLRLRKVAYLTAYLAVVCSPYPLSAAGQAGRSETSYLFNDAHFHLTNYVQKGLTAKQYVAMMGKVVKRSTMFGIPLQQT